MAKPITTVHLASEQLDTDGLHVVALRGREAIGELFHFDVEVATTGGAELEVDAVTGAEATIRFEHGGELVRLVHGVVVHVRDRLEATGEHRSYVLTLAPRAHRLDMVRTQEVFLDASVPEIIAAKVARHGLGGALDRRLLGSYPARDFVVQYGETDWRFVCRLAEHVGISLFFEHDDDGDHLVMADHNGAFGAATGDNALPFSAHGEQQDVFRIEQDTALLPRRVAVLDYNYRTPEIDLCASHDVAGGQVGGVAEYGGHFKTTDEAAALARVRAEELACRRRELHAESDLSRVTAGIRRRLSGHPRLEGELLVTEVEHEARQTLEGFRDAQEEGYDNRFVALLAQAPYRPLRRTPRPRIDGILTGIVEPEVEGKAHRTGRIDGEGRYLVKLMFDTGAVSSQRPPSKPIRMAQPYGGERDGMHFPLKAGTEVAIAFIDGDPDRPLILGAIPSPVNPSPVTQKNSLQNRIQTESGIVIQFGAGD